MVWIFGVAVMAALASLGVSPAPAGSEPLASEQQATTAPAGDEGGNGEEDAEGDEKKAEALFFDDFKDGDAKGWKEINGRWSVKDDQYVQSTHRGESRTIAGDASWTDYAVEARMMLTEGKRDAGIIARYVDDKNFYFMEVKAKAFKIQRKAKGKWHTVAEARPKPPIPHNVWLDLRFEVQGDTLRHYVNGKLKLEGKDKTHAKGKIGLRSFQQAMKYDHVRVTALAEEQEQKEGKE